MCARITATRRATSRCVSGPGIAEPNHFAQTIAIKRAVRSVLFVVVHIATHAVAIMQVDDNIAARIAENEAAAIAKIDVTDASLRAICGAAQAARRLFKGKPAFASATQRQRRARPRHEFERDERANNTEQRHLLRL